MTRVTCAGVTDGPAAASAAGGGMLATVGIGDLCTFLWGAFMVCVYGGRC